MASDKNPWGNTSQNNKSSKSKSSGSNRSGGTSGGGHNNGPDMDDVLKNLQDQIQNTLPGGGKLIVLGIVAIIALWMASGFYVINPGEYGVVQRFGAHHRTQATEGLGYHFPNPIENLTKVNVTNVRTLNIGFSVVGKSRSGSIQKRDIPSESLMLTSDANIVDLDLVVQWNVKSAEDYLFNIKDQESTIKKVAESAIREVVGQTNMFPIITNLREQVANRAKAIMIQNLDEYKSGVNIKQVLIQEAEVHPNVQAAFQDVQSAKQDAEKLKNEAQKHREKIIPVARGNAKKVLQEAEAYKEAQVSKALGDASRFNAVYDSYLKGKEVTRERIYIETMEDIFTNAKSIIIDQQAGSGVVPYLPLNELQKKK